jgi:hypothetical protein
MSYAYQDLGSVFFASIILGWFRIPFPCKGSFQTGDKGIVQVQGIPLNNALKQVADGLSTDTSV